MDYFGSRMAHSHKSRSVVKIVLQFCTMKAAKRDMEIILMVFLKKIWKYDSGQLGLSGPKMVRPHNFGLALQISFFLEKSYSAQFDLFRSFFTVSLDVVKSDQGHCYYWIFNKQPGKDFFRDCWWILKQSGHD